MLNDMPVVVTHIILPCTSCLTIINTQTSITWWLGSCWLTNKLRLYESCQAADDVTNYLCWMLTHVITLTETSTEIWEKHRLVSISNRMMDRQICTQLSGKNNQAIATIMTHEKKSRTNWNLQKTLFNCLILHLPRKW